MNSQSPSIDFPVIYKYQKFRPCFEQNNDETERWEVEVNKKSVTLMRPQPSFHMSYSTFVPHLDSIEAAQF